MYIYIYIYLYIYIYIFFITYIYNIWEPLGSNVKDNQSEPWLRYQMFTLHEKMDEKKEQTKRKISAKKWKGKGEPERIASCSFCALFILFLFFLAVFFCHFLPVETCKRKHISCSIHFGEAISIYREWVKVRMLHLSSWGRFPFKGGNLLSSPFPPCTVQAHFLVPGFWSCKMGIIFGCHLPQKQITQTHTPADDFRRNVQAMPQTKGVRPSWRITPLNYVVTDQYLGFSLDMYKWHTLW